MAKKDPSVLNKRERAILKFIEKQIKEIETITKSIEDSKK